MTNLGQPRGGLDHARPRKPAGVSDELHGYGDERNTNDVTEPSIRRRTPSNEQRTAR